MNVYLLLSLHRLDIFPLGDLALVKSLVANGFVAPKPDREAVLAAAEPFRPYRSIFAILIWHDYIRDNGVTIP